MSDPATGAGLHVYCVVPGGAEAPSGGGAGDPPADLSGVGGGRVEALGAGRLDVWVERLEGPLRPSIGALQAHHDVVEAACARGPCLPHRFGTRFPDEERLTEAFGPREEELLEGLERVAGCLEFAVRIATVEGSPVPSGRSAASGDAPAGRGTRHLLRLARREAEERERARRAETLSADLEDRLQGALRAVRWEPLPAARGLAAVAHLVPEPRIPGYREGLESWAAGRPDLRITTTGPWPPYSFTP